MAHLHYFLLAEHLQCRIGEVADDRFHITTDITHLGELGRFHLDERRVGELRQTTGDLGLADTGGADHQDVLWGHFRAQLGGELHPSPAVAQGNGNGTLGVVLADDMAIEFVDDLAGRHGHGAVLRGSRAIRSRCRAPRW